MNTHKLSLLWSIAAASTIPACAFASDRSHRCAELVDDARRLACYDAEYGKPGKGAAAGAPATLAPVVQPPTDARLAQDNKLKAPKSVSVTATASITGLSSLLDGRFKATLDSGEVWTQLEPDKAVVLAVGDKVTIKKALLGSFLLTTPGGVATRVKRVQ